MQCWAKGCDEDAAVYILTSEQRVPVQRYELCADHANRLTDSYYSHSARGPETTAQLEGAACFDIERLLFSFTDESKCQSTIHLREMGGVRRLDYAADAWDARELYCHLLKLASPRPRMHQAMANAIEALGGRLHDVLVDEFVVDEWYFYGKLRIAQDDRILVLDMPPSDAFILAVVLDVPIFVTENVLRELGRMKG